MNTPKRRILLLFVAFAATGVVFLAVAWQPSQPADEVLRIAREGPVFTVTEFALPNASDDLHPGTVAPDFRLMHANGSYWLSDFRGEVVVLNLMATWCVSCQLEISHLQDVWETYTTDVVLVSVDVDPTESAGTLSALIQEFRDASWIWALDRSNLALTYGVASIPKTVIIDPDGYIRVTYSGVVPAAVLIQEIGQLLPGQGA